MVLPKVLFRTDGNNQIGLGHIYRCLALAEILKPKFDSEFAIRNPSVGLSNLIISSGFRLLQLSAEIAPVAEAQNLLKELPPFETIVLDGYMFDSAYQKKIKESGRKVISIDDTCSGHFFADVIINHAPGVSPHQYSCEKYTSLYLGPRYALLREPFASAKPKVDFQLPLSRLLISFGGADPYNFTLRLLQMVVESDLFDTITVITGSAYSHRESLDKFILSAKKRIHHFNDLNGGEVYEQMRNADMAIVPSSTMLLETLATGTIAVTGYYMNNQKLIYEGFLKLGWITGLGDLNKLTPENLTDKMEILLADGQHLRSMLIKVATGFDGGVKERVMKIFTTVFNRL